ncbi:DUF3108 domain-containing protein [bacterium]|nr:DUF3108 domain-containing protein [bacterium]
MITSKKVAVVILGLVMGLMIGGCAKKEPLPPIEVKPIGAPAKIGQPITKAFQDGEELTFTLKYLGIIAIGKASVKVKEWLYQGREVYYLTVEMKSSPFFSFFYKVEDCIESYLDAQKLHSLRFIEHLREGRHLMEKETIYDQKKHIAAYTIKTKNRTYKVKVPADVKDALSALYYLRAQEFKEGGVVEFSVNNHKDNYQVKVKILGKEKIKTPTGQFLAWRIQPTITQNGNPQKGRAIVWLTADEKKIPLLLKARTPIGPVTAYLSEIKL